ncbi:unnamed protein product [Periconia digitata]|uniref:Uncharacterized protein n=1 Tax=Periconia digitata TaxID=1303443 RepID=A0A9W4URZ2_9PLEO|nr:unnamed protein product [Periconia digitata]
MRKLRVGGFLVFGAIDAWRCANMFSLPQNGEVHICNSTNYMLANSLECLLANGPHTALFLFLSFFYFFLFFFQFNWIHV